MRLIALALIALAPFAARADDNQPNLCAAGETPVFACTAEGNGKLVSVCKGPKSLAYRFGKPAKPPELVFPDAKADGPASSHFHYKHTGLAKGADDELSFSNGKIRYVISHHQIAQADGDTAQLDVEDTKKSKHLATLKCTSIAANWDLLSGVIPNDNEAAEKQKTLACKGLKAGDIETQQRRENLETSILFSFAAKTFGAPLSCSVKVQKYEGQSYPTFLYKFKGAQLEEGAQPPESSLTELKTAAGFPDAKAAEAVVREEAKKIGLKVDWTQGGDDPDVKTYQDPEANASIELESKDRKLIRVSISMAL